MPTSKAILSIGIILVMLKAVKPAKTEEIAAFGPQFLNIGINPNNNGTAIGPNRAPNQVTMRPNTPPKYSY